MTADIDTEKLKARVRTEVRRIQKAKREQRTLLAHTIYLGTLGLIFVLPVIAGAYLGRWLDERLPGYSFSWTVTLIVLGVFVGAMNVYFFVRE
jgi:ATP synthase protein I